MVKNKDVDFSKKAELLATSKKSDAIKIDHLAFSFPLHSLKGCINAGSTKLSRKIKTGTKKEFFTGKEVSIYKSIKQGSIFPDAPKPKSFQSGEFEEFEKYKLEVHKQLAEYYEKTLKIFVEHVFGFEVSPMRGRGLHGYKDSMTLRTTNGVDVGFIGIGGQRDTIYFQISGTGCKYLFSRMSTFVLHHWLVKVLGISKLSRLDLAFDCYDNNFNCTYATTAYKDGAFSSGLGGRPPEFGLHHKFTFSKNMEPDFTVEMVSIGKRTSPVYWRIYNKKLEQGIKDAELTWHRNEVELKKWDADSLLNVGQVFAGLCPFSASMDLNKGIKTKCMTIAKEACLDLAARAKHVRHSAGKALGDILEIFEGDIAKTLGVILPNDTGGKYGIPPTYQKLINQVIEV
jgi:phage replication initiation protein